MTDPTPAAPTPVDAKDLNLLVPADKRVLFGKPPIVYVVPGDMPMDVYLLAQSSMINENEVEATRQLHSALVTLLTWNLEDEDEKTTVTKQVSVLGVRTMMRVLNAVYVADLEPADEDDDASGEAQADGGTTTTNSTASE